MVAVAAAFETDEKHALVFLGEVMRKMVSVLHRRNHHLACVSKSARSKGNIASNG